MITILISSFYNIDLGYSNENETSKRKLHFAYSEACFQKIIRDVVLMGKYTSITV